MLTDPTARSLVYLIAILLFGFGFFRFYKEFRIRNGWQRSEGTVTGKSPYRENHVNLCIYFVKYTFNSIEFNSASPNGLDGRKFSIGETVDIWINPNDSKKIVIDDFPGSLFIPAVIMFVALVLTLIAVSSHSAPEGRV